MKEIEGFLSLSFGIVKEIWVFLSLFFMPIPPAIEPSTTREGRYEITSSVGSETVNSFVPPCFPPRDEPIRLGELAREQERASIALGRLETATKILPERHLLQNVYIRKEALISSHIEGTQFSMHEVLQKEPTQELKKGKEFIRDWMEILNATEALEYGRKQLSNLPISGRLLCEIHQKLLVSSERGSFRRSQNWIGGSRPGNALYVPPLHSRIPDLLGELEQFINSTDNLPYLIKAGLLHAQFETIHPFLDGNGRVGRMLILLYLYSVGLLKEAVFYPSLYFKKNRTQYYDHLQKVREQGAWEPWLKFFLEGLAVTADDCCDTLLKVFDLFKDNDRKIDKSSGAQTLARIHNLLKKEPIIVRQEILKLGISSPTAKSAVDKLEKLGIITKRKDGREVNYIYTAYYDLLAKDTEPLPRDT